jgi:hypothetical protein
LNNEELLREFRTKVFLGDYDDELSMLIDTIRDRLAAVEMLKHQSMPPGSLVRFNDFARPQYLIGVPATVTERKDKRVVVILGQDVGRFKKGSPIRAYTNTLDLISQPEPDA